MTKYIKTPLRCALLATAAIFTLTACGGGDIDTPGDTSVVINTGGGADPVVPITPSADVDLVAGECSAGTTLTVISNAAGSVEACSINAPVVGNVTLDPAIGYVLEGAVFVGEDTAAGGVAANLNVPAGTTIFGSGGEDFIVVSRGSTIQATGTASDPIIMTSIQDIQGTVDPINDRGLWGGLILNGFAPQNDCISATAVGGTAACEAAGEGGSGLFGGGNPADNSGTLQFLQVRFAGNQISGTNELNGISFQGVGNGTTCDHLQVHNNQDDGIEFFGGTVNCSFLALTGNADDSLDYTDGWTGSAQFVLVEHGPGAGDQGFEFDNNGNDNDALPRSNPTIANYTLIGNEAAAAPTSDVGALIREGTAGTFCNGVITGFTDGGIDIDQTATFAQITAGDLTFESALLDNDTNIISGDSSETFDTAASIGGMPNVTEGTVSLVDDFFPGANESAVTPCDLTVEAADADLDIDNVSYIGAFGPTESPASSWATGWTFGLFD